MPEQVLSRRDQVGRLPAFGLGGRARSWAVANFRLGIDGVDTGRVARIEPLAISQPIARQPGAGLEVAAIDAPDLEFTVASNGAQGFEEWFDEAVVRGAGQQRNGQLELLGPSLRQALFTIDLHGLGVCRLRHEVARVRVQAYSQRMSFTALPA